MFAKFTLSQFDYMKRHVRQPVYVNTAVVTHVYPVDQVRFLKDDSGNPLLSTDKKTLFTQHTLTCIKFHKEYIYVEDALEDVIDALNA